MAAPSSAYGSKALKDKTTPQNYLMCKFLGEYTSIGTHFYLDKIVRYKDGSTFYFGGACVVGSENSKFHTSARIGKLFDGIELYTDGGLNTLGECSTANNVLRYANIILHNAYFKSSYYNSSTAFGLKYRINSNSWVTAPNQDLEGSLPSTLSEKLTFNEPLAIYPPANKGDFFEVKAYIVNDEGVMEGAAVGFLLDDRIENVDATYRVEAQDPSGEISLDFWMLASDYSNLSTLTDAAQNTGIYGHTTVFRTTPIASGWYVGILEDKALYVDSTGQFTNYTELVPLQWEVQCAVGMTQPTPESNFFHNSAMFELNFNAPSDVLLNGRISKTPADQPADNVIAFSATILQGTTIIETETGQGYEYLPDTNYYLIVTAPNHPQITFFGDGQFLP